MNSSKLTKIKKNGYVIIPNFLSKNDCIKLEKILDKIELKKIKEKNKYFQDCILKGQVVIRDLICHDIKFLNVLSKKKILKFVYEILKDQFILDGVTGSRPILTNNKYPKPHIDSHIPIKDFQNTLDVVLQLCVNDFTKNNGATNFWKKSHISGKKCQSENVNYRSYKKIQPTAKRGSLIIFLGQTWHQLGKNSSGDKRWGVLYHLKKWWIKPSSNYSNFFSKSFIKFNNQQKMLLGFSSVSPLPFSKRLKTKIELKSLPKDYKKLI